MRSRRAAPPTMRATPSSAAQPTICSSQAAAMAAFFLSDSRASSYIFRGRPGRGQPGDARKHPPFAELFDFPADLTPGENRYNTAAGARSATRPVRGTLQGDSDDAPCPTPVGGRRSRDSRIRHRRRRNTDIDVRLRHLGQLSDRTQAGVRFLACRPRGRRCLAGNLAGPATDCRVDRSGS